MHYSSIDDVAAAIRARDLSPVELIDATLERIERHDPVLQGYARVSPQVARAAARAAEDEIRAGAWRGPLHGVPVAVKDLYGTTDEPTTFGSSHLAQYRLAGDAEAVQGLRRAGAVIVGTLRMSEAALTDHGVGLPVPLNPWDSATWVGTSSSGCAAATSAGLCYASLGSDTGGSIRGPATATGLTGLKTTRGAVPAGGTLPLSRTLDTLGPFARSARDCRIVFEAIARAGARPGGTRGEGRAQGRRIGIDPNLLKTVSGETRSMIEQTADTFAELGAAVVEVATPDGAHLAADWVAFVGAEAVADLADLYPPSAADRYGPEIAYVLEQGRSTTPADLDRITASADRYRSDLDAALDGLDALLLPTVGTPSPTVADVDRMRLSYEVWNHEVMRLTCPMNYSGHPSLTLPTGFTGRGTPEGAQLVGRHHDENLLLTLGEAFQEATDFHRRHPASYP
ncbi:amidase [Pseudactinotalea sp. HY158]|uniref:amidase n=1 Tax=Pseudactinotalea sp. HY158 TaxID=2654547 RepID=UPI00129C7A73|nr:amidase [Pseudactinotalea sp. HY158]QGH70058.1 Asp-tRNA(Asn)/Glu-tRNA(Gln) amidotransferase GatCAB subunit A [Pseudactinotalea sp. HY158]